MRNIFWLFLGLTVFQASAQEDYYFEWAKQIEILSSLSEKLMNNYVEEPNPEVLMNDAIKGMLSKTDRFTLFYTEQQMFDQRLRQSGKFSGIGIKVFNHKKGLAVAEVFPDSPAMKSGLRIGDVIVEIEGKDLKELKYKTKKDLLSGKPGSEVKIKVLRLDKEKRFTVKREIIQRKAVSYATLLDDGKTGYVKLDKFTKTAAREIQSAFVDLKNKGMQRLILDLRGNPGGLLSQAVNTVNLFMPANTLVVETKGRFERFNKKYFTKREALDETIPLIILVNGRSASASEIVSGTLQDYDRAVIVGDTTYGKGLVQRFFPLKYGTYVKITISKYYIPSGRQIQKIDYWHRDENGKPAHYKQNREQVFYTKNKRKVYEHGGIAPDVLVKSDTILPLVRALRSQNILFDFDTQFREQHKNLNNPGDLAGMQIMDELVQYLKKNHLDPETPAEKQLDKMLDELKDEKSANSLINQWKKTAEEWDKQQIETLVNDPLIKRQTKILIMSDLMLRYFGKDKQNDFRLKNDPVVKKALEILDQNNQYQKILKSK